MLQVPKEMSLVPKETLQVPKEMLPLTFGMILIPNETRQVPKEMLASPFMAANSSHLMLVLWGTFYRVRSALPQFSYGFQQKLVWHKAG